MRLPKPEAIGAPDCPLFLRWTLWPLNHERPGETHEEHVAREGEVPFKLLFHRFLANADDRDVHDHPRAFWTLVLKGGYDDMAPCSNPACADGYLLGGWMGGTAERPYPDLCPHCTRGFVLNERMRAGMLRHRPAEHKHRTRVHPDGCWTIVVMGKLVRPWGFWRRGEWYGVKEYEEKFGFGMRCD